MTELELKVKVLATARAMNAGGINRGSAGNVSVRHAGGFLITPTGMAYDACVAEDVVFVGLDGRCDGRRKPSSEWRIHRDVYAARPEAGAIIHAHSTFAVSLACQGRDIPPFHYMVARFGGRDVRCCAYATFGSQELSDAVVAALADRKGCLMAHHGMVVLGANLDQALALGVELETLCEQYWRVLQIGAARLLPDDEMTRVLAKFADYGRQD